MVVARFERDQQSLGFDTENVAYFGRHAPEGTTINKSALGQFAGSICALMRFHLWAHCYDSFKRLMANPNIEKVGNAVGTDVTKLKARFPDLVCVGIVELSSLVKAAFPDLPNGKISTMVSHVLKLHLDKRVDHRLWEALHYTKRQLAYAANDADAAKRLALAVYLLREGATAAPAAPAATPIEGALDEDEQHETAVDHDTGARVACTRETVVVDSDDDGDAASDDELEIPGMATDEPSDAAAAVDADSADATSALSQSPSSRVGECGIVRFKAMITDYHNSGRTDRLELPSSLTDDERKVLHRHCDHFGLYHRSRGPATARIMTITRWRPIQTQPASIGDRAIGALVALDFRGNTHRGYVCSFDRDSMRWEAAYSSLSSTPSHKEAMGIDCLNLRMQRRFDYDHGSDGLGERGSRPAMGSPLSGDDAALLEKFLAGLDEDWTTSEWSYLQYDPAHFMRCFGDMLSVDKHSDVEKCFNGWLSQALFKPMAGEHERGRLHAKKLGMTPEQIKRLARKYWKRRLKYFCPTPDMIIRHLFDIYIFFRQMDDPLRPGVSCLKSNAIDILIKEMWYVQRGLLSDLPEIPRYSPTARCPTTGFMLYRCLATASPLEGMHFHYRQAQHPGAKSCSLKLMHARSCAFDFAWNVNASVKARLMPDVGHFNLWLVDALVDVYFGLGIPPARIPLLFRK